MCVTIRTILTSTKSLPISVGLVTSCAFLNARLPITQAHESFRLLCFAFSVSLALPHATKRNRVSALGVIIFGSDQEVAGVMRAVRRLNATGTFVWIGNVKHLFVLPGAFAGRRARRDAMNL